MSLIANLPSLETVIKAHGLITRKSLGQHFLLDADIIRSIAAYAGDLSGCTVIEIGAGPGGLTRALLEKNARKIIAIEKDERCLPILRQLQEASSGRLEIVAGDALIHDLLQYPPPRKIVANLPYNVGTELLLRWLADLAKDSNSYQSMTLMFQKEVAERITAISGNKSYGRLSVFSQWLCETRYDMELPPEVFMPPPKVSSGLVTLIPRKNPLFKVNQKTLETLLAKAFGQRRKMLRSSLKGLVSDVEQFLQRAGINSSLRAEQVDLEGFGRMAILLETTNKIC